jgi:phage terminase large subunit-like protein
MNKKQKTITTEEEAIKRLDDPVIRKEITKSDFFMFFTLYFSHHIKYGFASMHKEMMALCQDASIILGLIMAFRGSGKSTIITTAFPLWSILGIPQNKFIVIVAKTKPQSKLIMNNIKAELESNNQLKSDLGPFQEISDEWGSETIVFSKQNARITVVSIEQSLKGLRHRQHRPDLIILDDIEDNESTKTKEMREKTYDKYKREIVPLGDLGTRIIHVGNMLHDNSLIMRLSREIKDGDGTRVFKKYPIVDDDNTIYWPSKFPTLADIETERLKVNDDVAWHLEYLLKVISGNEQIIKNEEIQYYIDLPKKERNPDGYHSPSYIVVGVDPAIAPHEKADYTAIVPILCVKDNVTQKYVAYVLKDFVHKRLDVNETIDTIIGLNQALKVYNVSRVVFVIESVGYQIALAQLLIHKDKNYIEIVEKRTLIDKETRLRLTKPIFATHSIYFPEEGASVIINEIIGFGREKNDDLVDALMYSIEYAYGSLINQQEVIIV